jgi:hypothetical protein
MAATLAPVPPCCVRRSRTCGYGQGSRLGLPACNHAECRFDYAPCAEHVAMAEQFPPSDKRHATVVRADYERMYEEAGRPTVAVYYASVTNSSTTEEPTP